MTATFWTGSSLSFTNGSKIVTVNTGPSLDSVKANSSLTAGNYNEPVEVKSVSGNTITLYSNWPGSTGTTSATIKPSAAAAASAGVAAQQLITDIQSLVSSASATATANSFVKRDSNGRIKAASPSANDDVVNQGYLGSAATKDVGTSAGNVMTVGAGGLLARSIPTVSDANSVLETGFYSAGSAWIGSPVAGTHGDNQGYLVNQAWTVSSGAYRLQKFFNVNNKYKSMWRRCDNGVWSEWKENYHSGNTNFNEFGGLSGDVVMSGANANSTLAVFYRDIPFNSTPTGVSVTGSFKIRSPLSNTILASGVTPVFNAANSSRTTLVLTVSTSGLPANREPLELVAETTASITIN